MVQKNWGHTGTFTGNASSEAVSGQTIVMIGIEAGAGTVTVECQMPESSTWLPLEAIDASADVVKVYDGLGLPIRLTMSSYSVATNYWLIGR